MKPRISTLGAVTGALALGIAVAILARRTAPPRGPVAPAGNPATAEAPGRGQRATLGGPERPDPAALAAALRPVRSAFKNALWELSKRRGPAALTPAEMNAVAEAIADSADDIQVIERRLSRVTATDASRTTVSVPAFPDEGRTLEQELRSGIVAALGDPQKGAELADELAVFLTKQFRGFGQYPREISIGVIRDDSGAPYYAFEDHWTGGWSGKLGGQPADGSVTAADRSEFRPDDLQDYEFLRPFLPEIAKTGAPAPAGVPPEP